MAQANSAPATQAWDGSLYGSAPGYNYLDKTPVSGVFVGAGDTGNTVADRATAKPQSMEDQFYAAAVDAFTQASASPSVSGPNLLVAGPGAPATSPIFAGTLPTTVVTPTGSYQIPPEVAGYGTLYGGGVEQHYASAGSLSGESWFSAPLEGNYAQSSGRMFADVSGNGNQPGLSRSDIENQIQWELNAQAERDASLQGGVLFKTAGPTSGLRGIRPPIEMVRNGNWDAALNLVADPLGLLGEVTGLQGDLQKLSDINAEKRINVMRDSMRAAGMKNVPGYAEAWDANGNIVRDYNGTLKNLQSGYEDFVRDQRLSSTWGDDYRSVRVGRSQMTVTEFEKRTLDLQQNAANRAYERAVQLIESGDLKVSQAGYAATLGSFVDKVVRDDLRSFARSEGISEGRMSGIWGVNRSISDGTLRGIPDNRLGSNLFVDTTLANKSGSTLQIMKWNEIRPDANYVIIRPTNMPGVQGSYVIRPQSILPYGNPNRRGM